MKMRDGLGVEADPAYQRHSQGPGFFLSVCSSIHGVCFISRRISPSMVGRQLSVALRACAGSKRKTGLFLSLRGEVFPRCFLQNSGTTGELLPVSLLQRQGKVSILR